MATTGTPTTTNPTTIAGQPGAASNAPVGTESSLSNWAGPYVTEMLGRGRAAASQPYQAYTGPLTAGSSPLQEQAFQGLASLAIPTAAQTSYTPGQFSAEDAQRLMNPYLRAALDPQIAEAQRQSQIQNLANRTAATRAGAFGGGRQALMESEAQRNLQQQLAGITGQGYNTAYNQAMQQFNTEQQQRQQAAQMAQNYGLAALQKQAEMGNVQRGIEQEGITADINQFKEERDYPYKQVQYMQSLLQGLPLAAQSTTYSQPSTIEQIFGGAGAARDYFDKLFGPPTTTTPTTTTPTTTTPTTTTPTTTTPTTTTPTTTTSPGTTQQTSAGVTTPNNG